MRCPGRAPPSLARLWVTCLPDGRLTLSPPRVAGRPTLLISALGILSPVHINVLIAGGSRLVGRRVKSDS